MDLLFRILDFLVETRAIVADDHPFLVAHVCFPQSYIFLNGFFHCFVPCLVGKTVIELGGTVGCCDHVHNSVVAVVSQGDLVVTHVIAEHLPYLLRHIGTTVQQPTIDQQNDGLVSNHLCYLQEGVLQRHLLLHQSLLEHQTLLLCEGGTYYHGSTLHDNRCGLRYDQYFIAQLLQVL